MTTMYERMYKWRRFAAVLLVLVAILVPMQQVYASATAVVVIGVAAVVVVTSILVALGVVKGSDTAAFDTMVDGVISRLGTMGAMPPDHLILMYAAAGAVFATAEFVAQVKAAAMAEGVFDVVDLPLVTGQYAMVSKNGITGKVFLASSVDDFSAEIKDYISFPVTDTEYVKDGFTVRPHPDNASYREIGGYADDGSWVSLYSMDVHGYTKFCIYTDLAKPTELQPWLWFDKYNGSAWIHRSAFYTGLPFSQTDFSLVGVTFGAAGQAFYSPVTGISIPVLPAGIDPKSSDAFDYMVSKGLYVDVQSNLSVLSAGGAVPYYGGVSFGSYIDAGGTRFGGFFAGDMSNQGSYFAATNGYRDHLLWTLYYQNGSIYNYASTSTYPYYSKGRVDCELAGSVVDEQLNPGWSLTDQVPAADNNIATDYPTWTDAGVVINTAEGVIAGSYADGVAGTVEGTLGIPVSIPDDPAAVGSQTQTGAQQGTISDSTVEAGKDAVSEAEAEQTVKDLQLPADITGYFPFCIPFDIIRGIQMLQAPAVTPKFEIPLSAPEYGLDYTFVLDFGAWETVGTIIAVLRWGQAFVFVVALAAATKNHIWG